MRLSRRYGALLVWIFAGMFFLANAGFTLVISTCPAKGIACCSMPGSVQCAGSGSSAAASGLIAQAGTSCRMTLVAGGLLDRPVIQDPATQHRSTEIAQAVDPVAATFCATPDLHPSHLLLPIPSRGSPPGVEKFVLFSSFLI